ncbi:hypothetical protein R3P38DRAFT_3177013 [Favolaschia claudopus]|uniref:Uncharacterized protein n=1 Tax=Favolaschia claudopus TaxID=2862362 RepID=A0AAW0D0E9_9AGAR
MTRVCGTYRAPTDGIIDVSSSYDSSYQTEAFSELLGKVQLAIDRHSQTPPPFSLPTSPPEDGSPPPPPSSGASAATSTSSTHDHLLFPATTHHNTLAHLCPAPPHRSAASSRLLGAAIREADSYLCTATNRRFEHNAFPSRPVPTASAPSRVPDRRHHTDDVVSLPRLPPFRHPQPQTLRSFPSNLDPHLAAAAFLATLKTASVDTVVSASLFLRGHVTRHYLAMDRLPFARRSAVLFSRTLWSWLGSTVS